MKKLILSFVLFVQLGFAMANDNKPVMVVQVKNDHVKMFQQAGNFYSRYSLDYYR